MVWSLLARASLEETVKTVQSKFCSKRVTRLKPGVNDKQNRWPLMMNGFLDAK